MVANDHLDTSKFLSYRLFAENLTDILGICSFGCLGFDQWVGGRPIFMVEHFPPGGRKSSILPSSVYFSINNVLILSHRIFI